MCFFVLFLFWGCCFFFIWFGAFVDKICSKWFFSWTCYIVFMCMLAELEALPSLTIYIGTNNNSLTMHTHSRLFPCWNDWGKVKLKRSTCRLVKMNALSLTERIRVCVRKIVSHASLWCNIFKDWLNKRTLYDMNQSVMVFESQ